MNQTPSESREMDLQIWRNKVSNSLRDLADLIDATSRTVFPTPDIFVSLWSVDEPTDDNPYATRTLDVEDARIAMANMPGQWHKYNHEGSLAYVKSIGDPIRVRFEIDRSRTCKRVEVGTKHVEATEAHDEPIYKWVCDEPEPEVTNA